MVVWRTGEDDMNEARRAKMIREAAEKERWAKKRAAESMTLGDFSDSDMSQSRDSTADRDGPTITATTAPEENGDKNNPRKDFLDLLSDFDKDFDFSEVFKRNKAWAQTKRSQDPEFFSKLAKGQSPSILWIGCSDARVPANLLIGADSGAVFVHRNIANQVLAIDVNAQASLHACPSCS